MVCADCGLLCEVRNGWAVCPGSPYHHFHRGDGTVEGCGACFAAEPVTSFTGPHAFLSNFYAAAVISPEDHLTYPTLEHAFQAAKSESLAVRMMIQTARTPGQAKRDGRAISPIRADWEDVKRLVMLRLVLEKFTQHEALADQLLATGGRLLIEGNSWGDEYWGMVRRGGGWRGQNHLGKILMSVRGVL